VSPFLGLAGDSGGKGFARYCSKDHAKVGQENNSCLYKNIFCVYIVSYISIHLLYINIYY
jgi:hypothetical protein